MRGRDIHGQHRDAISKTPRDTAHTVSLNIDGKQSAPF
jgi:hypothetical protein